MSSDELLDLVNNKDEIIGTVWKSEAHNNPKIIHREVGIAVFNNRNEVLLQQRSLNKTKGPGTWATTAAGHIRCGEKPIQTIKRESQEELGLTVEPIYFDKIFDTYKGKESRFIWVYYAFITNTPNIRLQLDEVMDYAWVKIDQLEKFTKSHKYNLNGTSHKMISQIIKKLRL